ncbi:paraquat-inducible protein A [Neomegalonema perideroedes]|uniref:paraquat-inducible protein A n=1 Tax=Neomegalonema perideroedes TaxID=217219 RepID=UPI00036B9ED6|nr:paraquat-inducible protein A [Neomegalonema perideroedes]
MTTAREAGLIACLSCGALEPMASDGGLCSRCGGRLRSRRPYSLQRSAAWLALGLMAYVPANLWPIMRTTTLGRGEDNTILGGVWVLAHHGSWDLAAVVFLASVAVPMAKFCVVGLLLWGLAFGRGFEPHKRHRLHEIVEYIGRWSMLDVFVVAILAALVQVGPLASITPGPAAGAFGLSVAFTMLSAQALDPRLLWDAGKDHA